MARFALIAAMLSVTMIVAGCASNLALSKVEPEKVYRTGSNIAQRDHAKGPGSNVSTKTVNTADPGFGIPGGIPTNGPHQIGH